MSSLNTVDQYEGTDASDQDQLPRIAASKYSPSQTESRTLWTDDWLRITVRHDISQWNVRDLRKDLARR